MTPHHFLDLSGLFCPLPILRVKKALAGLASEEKLEVMVTDPHAPEDLAVFCRQTGHHLLHCEEQKSATYRLLLQKK